jgi:small subunit ribosomal protein S1
MPEETSFARLMEKAGKQGTTRLRAGETVNATVIQIAEDFVFVDVGTPSDGRIARSELLDSSGKVKVRAGDSVQATVVDPRPDGPLLAVAFGHSDKLDLGTLELAQKSGAPIEAEVTKVVKGGLEVQVGGARAFCPASQMELSHVADFTPYVGQRFEFKVLEIRDGGRSIVLSRRALLEERRREAAEGARSRLVVGSDVEGAVQSLGRHGAVIDLDGVEGFVHLSELAAHRVERAEDAVKLGERVRARVLSVEDSPKGLRVRLSLRALLAQPEAAAPGSPAGAPPEEVLVGQVTRVLQHGVVVQTPRGEGLIPLRELGLAPGADHRRAYPPGKQLDVVIVSQAGGRLTFSATQVARVQERKNYREFSTAAAPSNPTTLGSLGDVLRGKLRPPSSENAPGPGAPKTEAPSPNARRRR